MADHPPPGGLRATPGQARAAQTVMHLLDAAVSLLVESGPDAVTTRAIADRAGVAVGTVYRYFTDRDQVLGAAYVRTQDEVSQRWFARFGDLRDASATRAATVLFDAYAREARSEPALLPLLRALHALATPYRPGPFIDEPDDLVDLFADRLGLAGGREHQVRIGMLKHLTLTLIDCWLLASSEERPMIRAETIALAAGMLDRLRGGATPG
ncbi:MAG: TetR/AcrR family transcriptional regulator [Dermatophilaceae bacterium]